jgi:hypothetical protein
MHSPVAEQVVNATITWSKRRETAEQGSGALTREPFPARVFVMIHSGISSISVCINTTPARYICLD